MKPPLELVHHNRLRGFTARRRSMTLTVKTKILRLAPKLVPAAPKSSCRTMQQTVSKLGINGENSNSSNKAKFTRNISSMIIIGIHKYLNKISHRVYKIWLDLGVYFWHSSRLRLSIALRSYKEKSYPQDVLPTVVPYVIMKLLSVPTQKQIQKSGCVREAGYSLDLYPTKTKQKYTMRRQLLAKLSGQKQSWATTRPQGRGLWLPFVIHQRFSSKLMLMVMVLYISIFLFYPVVFAGSLSEGFPTTQNYPSGTVVSIRNTVPTTIELANTNNSDYLVGVVEPEGDSLLTIKDAGSNVYVASTGEVEAFVSDVNGAIEKGDFIGASWISGVGMKAEKDTQQKLLGIALQAFSSSSTDAAKFANIETPSGKVSAEIGKIIVRLFDRQVGAGQNTQASSLENFVAKVTGREVAFARIVASLALFVVTLIISGVFLANAIRGSFISLGRNPLASGSIFASLMQVSGVSISLVLIGSVIAYLVLIL